MKRNEIRFKKTFERPIKNVETSIEDDYQKYVKTFKYRLGSKLNESSNESVSNYIDAPIDKQISSGISYDAITNKGNYILLSGMAVPGYILTSSAKANFIYWWYEYVIDGKVYRFELHK